MIRRAFALTVALGGLVLLTACSTVDKPAATVNGREIPMSEFADEVAQLQASELGQAGIGFVLNETTPQLANADATREWLQLRIIESLTAEVVEKSGQPLAQDQLDASRTEFSTSGGWDTLSPQLQGRILNIVVGGAVLQQEVTAALADAEIDVASTIGEWDADSLQVVAAGS